MLAGLGLLTFGCGAVGMESPGVIVPAKTVDRPVAPGATRGLLYFEREHRLNVGDRGNDYFDVSTPAPACGNTALVFDHARIVYKNRRFGKAGVVKKPAVGCLRCSPLVVGWYHEPTGYLVYQVHVYRRRIAGQCDPHRSR